MGQPPTDNRKRQLRRAARRAMSLVELLLVLALLVIVGAMTLPALEGPMANQRLRKSADLIRAAWNKARVKAMRTGRMQMFRFQPGTGTYQVQPWFSSEDAIESNDSAVRRAGQTPDMQGQAAQGRDKLSEGVTFHALTTDQDVRDVVAQQAMQSNVGQVSEDLGETWSQPMLFYPDGTSSEAQIVLANKRGSYVTIRLRGLTGVALVSDLQSAQEVQTQP